MKRQTYLKKVLSYYKEQKKETLLLLIITITLTIFDIIEPYITAYEYNSIFSKNILLIIKYTFILVAIHPINSCLLSIKAYINEIIKNNVETAIQKDLTNELLNIEMNNYEQKTPSYFIEKTISNANQLVSNFNYLFHDSFRLISTIGIIMYVINNSLNLFIVIYLLSLIQFYIRKKLQKKYEEDFKENSKEYIDNITFKNIIYQIKNIKILNIKESIIKEATNIKRSNDSIVYRNYKINGIGNIIESIIWSISYFVIIIYAAILTINHKVDASLIIVIFIYYYMLNSINYNIFNIYKTSKNIKDTIKEIDDVIYNNKYSKESFGNISKKDLVGNIELKNVSYEYDDIIKLKNINLKIENNTITGFVGNNQQCNLIINFISKLYTPNSGEILIDNIKINDYTKDTIYNNISVISSETYILNKSIIENIKITNPTVSDEEIFKACKLTKIHQYIENLPDKYNTIVNSSLPNHILKLISLTRAIIKKSKIILIEDIDIYDNQTDKFIETIKSVSKNNTIIIVTNKLSTIKNCNKIAVISEGKVSGYDRHSKLIKTNKIYKYQITSAGKQKYGKITN